MKSFSVLVFLAHHFMANADQSHAETAFMKQVVDEDLDFWVRELGGNDSGSRRRRNLHADDGVISNMIADEDVDFWTRELGGKDSSGSRRRRNLKVADGTKADEHAVDEDMDFWTRELGSKDSGSRRRFLRGSSDFVDAIREEELEFWTRELGGKDSGSRRD
eukprot:CAMPEP_0183307060 /NCGR_PEP_ID=MMETSP0160_2-20130417/15827_1 /TAXON_ID=2839 ORGANISM="Odontella Sinensis, Strain Grunow 1884" /NCGR_SAMPLE_ID=MMETSP0160_2 /ASSEMBLY_ACC=CAM_ASM_000250 /LENGTH=161 /DNA_ID=CAMNT_0025470563 /DNA_START=290 /DNA_END=775 /DNA_ORIENTATION=+